MSRTAEQMQRVEQLQQTVRRGGLSGALLLHVTDLLYFTATRQNGALWVPATGEPVFLVRKSLARAREESAIADVRPFPPSKAVAGALGARGRVGTTFDAVPAGILEFWRRVLPEAELTDLSRAVREQRSVKSPAEIEVMREGGRRLARVLGEVPSFLRAGMRELDVAAEIEARLRRAGNEGSPRLRSFNADLFVGLAVAGDSAAAPGFFDGPVVGRGLGPAAPLAASERRVREGEPVLCDYTAVFGGYVHDMTRVFTVGAPLPPELARAGEVAISIQEELARALVPGAVGEELWERACALAEEAGLGRSFMGPPGDQVKFVGHGVGLELDELPLLAAGYAQPLLAGQTVAIEPKFVFPGLGAVGVENTWVVTERGGDRLNELADGIVQVG